MVNVTGSGKSEVMCLPFGRNIALHMLRERGTSCHGLLFSLFLRRDGPGTGLND